MDGEIDDGWVGDKEYPDREQGEGTRVGAGLRCYRILSAILNIQMYSTMMEGTFSVGSLEEFKSKTKATEERKAGKSRAGRWKRRRAQRTFSMNYRKDMGCWVEERTEAV